MSERIPPQIPPSQILPLFIDSVRDYALLLLDPDGNVTSWNQGAQLIKGYAANEIISRHFSCFYPPDDAAAGKPQRELQHAAASGRFEDIGYRVRKDGSRFLANVVITAIRDSSGELLGYGKVTRDITERVEAEQRVQASEASQRTLIDTLFETVVDGLITINRAGRIQSYNKACARLFGYTRDEVIGNNIDMLIPQPDRGRHDSYVSEYLATGTAEIIDTGRDVLGRRKDGTVFPMRFAIGENHSNNEHAFVGIIHDLSEERRAQELLRVSEERLQLLIEAAPAAIAMFDRDMRYLAYSQRYAIDYGLGDQPLVGRSHYEVFPEIPEQWKEIHRRCLAGAVERSYEDPFPRADGGIDWVRWEIRPWHGARRAIGGVVLFSEIVTERKRAEEVLAETERQLRQAQTMEAVGQLSGGVAHDFNNLLAVIIGATEFLADEVSDHPIQAELVQEIMKSAESGAELTRRLLAYARRQPLQSAVIDLNEQLSGLMPMLQRTLGEMFHVTASFSDSLWQTRVDPAQINNALLNLAVNARDAMPEGGSLMIATANAHLSEDAAARMAELPPGDYAVLSVTDTGFGMSPEVIAHAIEPFFTTKPPGVGTGLGLSMVYGFARQSGGHLKIYSETGVGTTIRLYLPRSSDAGSVSRDAASDRVDLPRGNELILLVEDKMELSAIAARQLTSLGYTVRVAGDGRSALEILHGDDRFDLLFTDVVMPGGMNGYQLAELARQLRPEMAVLFTTGFARAPNPGSSDGGEPRRLLSKPYHRRQLAESIRAALTRSS